MLSNVLLASTCDLKLLDVAQKGDLGGSRPYTIFHP